MKRNRNSATPPMGGRVWHKNSEDDALIEYLLGELSDQERDRVEDKYFADSAFHERLLVLEEELTDSYVRGALSPEQRRHFEEWFLRTPERKQGLEFARALAGYTPAARISATETRSFWHPCLSFF